MVDTEIAELGGGCFWGVEDAFKRVKGVLDTEVGYEGGDAQEPTYEMVCGGDSGHAETVRVEYNPKEVSYSEILDVFFENHDPTQLNRQGPDIGSNYRSVIFYKNESQKKVAEKKIAEINDSGIYNDKVVTQLVPAQKFWSAEDYHQDYIEKNR